MNVRRAVAVFVCCGLLIMAAAAQRQPGKELPTVDDALTWLPPDTESVVVAQGPFWLPGSDLGDLDLKPGPVTLTEVTQHLQLIPFEVVGGVVDSKLQPAMKGNRILFAIEATRHFRDPLPGMDVMEFEGCSILVSEEPLGAQDAPLAEQLLSHGNRTERISGTTVAAFDHAMGKAKWTTYFAQASPGIAFFCDNVSFMRTTLERFHNPAGPRALPEHLPEWSYVDRSASFWAIRHYDPTQAAQDDTSPLREQTAMNRPDPQAIGIAFVFDPRQGQRAKMIRLTGNDAMVREEARKGARMVHPEEDGGYQVMSTKLAPGVLEVSMSLDRDSVLSEYLLEVMVDLGRGMYF